MKRILLAALALAALSTACSKKVDFREALPREGWKTYHDDVRGNTCYFYQHPTDADTHFGAGCVADHTK